MTACAITDHGVMGGVIEFYKNCKKAKIKPLLGVEAYITENKDGLENQDKERDNGHLILLAKNNKGLSDLMRLSSEAALQNFYYKPRIYKEKLKQLSGNVVCTTACIGGVLGSLCKFEEDQYAKCIACTDPDGNVGREIKFYAEIFGEDFYLELQCWDDGLHRQREYNKLISFYADSYKLPRVVTSDAHYLRKEDHELHELLVAMQIKKTIADYRADGEMQYGPYFYVKTPEEMLKEAKEIDAEEAYYNTMKIADKCNVEIELGKYRLPTFKIEEAADYEQFVKWKNTCHFRNSR